MPAFERMLTLAWSACSISARTGSASSSSLQVERLPADHKSGSAVFQRVALFRALVTRIRMHRRLHADVRYLDQAPACALLEASRGPVLASRRGRCCAFPGGLRVLRAPHSFDVNR